MKKIEVELNTEQVVESLNEIKEVLSGLEKRIKKIEEESSKLLSH